MNKLLNQSADEQHLSQRVVRWIFWLPIIGAVVLPITRLNKELYRFLIEEDGPIEWLQFGCFALAGIFAFGTACNMLRTRSRIQAAFFTVLAVGMIFCAGEEISWGQRIFGLETPESLKAMNKQNEITVHNIVGVLGPFNMVMMLGAAWGATAWYWNRKVRIERFWEGANHLLVPPFFLVPSFVFLFAYKLFRFTLWPNGGFTITKYGEWGEFCLAFSLCIYAWLNYRRTVTESEPQTIASPAPNAG